MPNTVPLPLAVVLTSFDPGGTERQMIELVRRLDPARWKVHVACFRARGGWFGRVAEAAASVAEFPVDSFRNPDTFRQMRQFGRWCRDEGIAVVHTAELYSNIFGLPAAAMAHVPVRIGNRREINPDKTAAQIALQRTAYTFAHKVVANSRAAADRLRAEHVPAAKVEVIPNGLQASQFQARVPSPGPRRIVVVANLREEKGHDVLIDAAPEILRRFPDARFECIGDGPLKAALEDRARARNVAHAFAFPGHREDIPARLAAADVFVLPSRSEAFPNALLEAMAAGLPIVASAVGGIRELVEDGRTGRLVPPGEPDLLADALADVIGHPEQAARMGAAARQEAVTHYSFERMVQAFETLYLSELTRRGRLDAAVPELAAS